MDQAIDYQRWASGCERMLGDWDRFVRELLLEPWTSAYSASTPWQPELLEVEAGELVYVYDAAPTLGDADAVGDDRVVVAWGRSAPPPAPRDRARLAGFLRGRGWALRGHDRGHLVAHAAGGGLDLNLIPQAATLNRGRSAAGRRWRAMEREAAEKPGTPLFVRPIYAGASWVPAQIEYGLVSAGFCVERFVNGS